MRTLSILALAAAALGVLPACSALTRADEITIAAEPLPPAPAPHPGAAPMPPPSPPGAAAAKAGGG
jgi:hypothetical protein